MSKGSIARTYRAIALFVNAFLSHGSREDSSIGRASSFELRNHVLPDFIELNIDLPFEDVDQHSKTIPGTPCPFLWK
jgi:hypothetical protein